MRTINLLLAIALVGMAYLVRLDTLLVVALLITAVLATLAVLPFVGQSFIRVFACVNALLMFFYFFRFFSAVPLLDYHWYAQVEYVPIWVVLVAGFASMHILADNSCCMKRELDETTQFSWSRLWGSSRERVA